MSTLKSLLVHVDASPQTAVRLQLAEQLALAHGAQATAIYAVVSALLRYPMAMAAGADMAPMLAEVDAQRLDAARKHYAATVQPAHVAWLECTGQPIADVAQQARKVTVASFDEGDEAAAEAGIVGYLRQHGVQASFKREVASEGDVGDQLLSLAADEQSDLLVMGCYGHGRAREWVLGGASRTVIESMTIPVLMSH